MYSWEIEEKLKSYNYYLDSYDYLQNIMDESPQIVSVSFQMMGERYSKYFVGTNDGYEWYIWIKNYGCE